MEITIGIEILTTKMDIAKHFHMNWINGETETRANERRVKTNDEKKK